MNTPRHHRLRAGALIAGVALTTVVATAGFGSAAGPLAATTPDFDADAYCAASLALEDAPEPDVEFESASEEEIAAAGQTYATDVIRPLADDIIAAAPSELADVAELFDSAVDSLAEDGDFAVFETPEMIEALQRAHEFDLETCGWNVVEVEAADYHFVDLPAELPAGPTSFELTNTGAEPHELLMFRKNDGVTATAEELLAMPEEEIFELVTFVDQAWAEPDDHGYTVHDLVPGDYVAICLVPVGLEEDAPPHAAEGMVAEFTVVA